MDMHSDRAPPTNEALARNQTNHAERIRTLTARVAELSRTVLPEETTNQTFDTMNASVRRFAEEGQQYAANWAAAATASAAMASSAHRLLEATVQLGVADNTGYRLILPATPLAQAEWKKSVADVNYMRSVIAPSIAAVSALQQGKPVSPYAVTKAAKLFDGERNGRGYLRILLTPAGRTGVFDSVIGGMQYIAEAFPKEQLDVAGEAAYIADMNGLGVGEASMPEGIMQVLASSEDETVDHTPLKLYVPIPRDQAKKVGDSRKWVDYKEIVGAGAEGLKKPLPETNTPIRLERLFLVDSKCQTYYAGRGTFVQPPATH